MGVDIRSYVWYRRSAKYYLVPDWDTPWETGVSAQRRVVGWVQLLLSGYGDTNQTLQAFLREHWHKPLPEVEVDVENRYWSVEQQARIVDKFRTMVDLFAQHPGYTDGKFTYQLVLGQLSLTELDSSRMFLTADGFTLLSHPIAHYKDWNVFAEKRVPGVFLDPPLDQFFYLLADPALISLRSYFQIKHYGMEL